MFIESEIQESQVITSLFSIFVYKSIFYDLHFKEHVKIVRAYMVKFIYMVKFNVTTFNKLKSIKFI